MKIQRTFDKKLIYQICTHPRIWPSISEDGQNKETWQPPIVDSIHWLLAIDDDVAGVYMLHPVTSICWEVHTCILPKYWGDKAKQFQKLLAKYVFTNLPCTKVITHVPSNNPLALKYALNVGMEIEWVNKRSILKNGKELDQTVLAIYKEQVLCQQQPQP